MPSPSPGPNINDPDLIQAFGPDLLAAYDAGYEEGRKHGFRAGYLAALKKLNAQSESSENPPP